MINCRINTVIVEHVKFSEHSGRYYCHSDESVILVYIFSMINSTLKPFSFPTLILSLNDIRRIECDLVLTLSR
ncbi:hypothetical protein EB796_009084 [Bugula neritina]|uniref:Uncharacterized protein n=1 Tax=Bugula neritina TaxID=10212 RepID=A0A7J7K1U1_BUGNE|nr:hypothetical protein EB796_009084 [Bugula neritina]